MGYYNNKKELETAIRTRTDRTKSTVREQISDFFAAFYVDEGIFCNEAGHYKYPIEIADLIVEWANGKSNKRALRSDNINNVDIDFLILNGKKLIEIIEGLNIDSGKKEQQIRQIEMRTHIRLNEVKFEMNDFLDSVKKKCGLSHTINEGEELTYTDVLFRLNLDDDPNGRKSTKYLDEAIERKSTISADDYTVFLESMLAEFKAVFEKYNQIYEAMNVIRFGEIQKNKKLLNEQQTHTLKRIKELSERVIKDKHKADSGFAYLTDKLIRGDDLAAYLDEKLIKLKNFFSDSRDEYIKCYLNEIETVIQKKENMLIKDITDIQKMLIEIQELDDKFAPEEINQIQDALANVKARYGAFESQRIQERRNAHMTQAEHNAYSLEIVDDEFFRTSEELVWEAYYNVQLDKLECAFGRTFPYNFFYDIAIALLPFEKIIQKYGHVIPIKTIEEIYGISGVDTLTK